METWFRENPNGKVVEVLGNSGEHETEIHAIMAEFGFANECFAPEVEAAAKN